MTEKTTAILRTIETMCDKVSFDLINGNIEITARLETTAPLEVLMKHGISIWVEDKKACWDEPEEYFERLRKYAYEELQEYKSLLTALEGLKASFSEYEAIFTLEPGIELIIDR